MKIEKNIPLTRNTKKRKYPLREMEIGDSFFVKTRDNHYDKNKIAASLYTCAKALNIDSFKVSTRREENGVRCWRIA